VVAISHSGSTKDVVETLEIAKQAGATTIAIVSHRKAPVATTADIALCVHARETGFKPEPMSSRIAHLSVIDVLSVGVALKRRRISSSASRRRARPWWANDTESSGRSAMSESRFERYLVTANRAIIFIMMAVMATLVFVNVVARYVLNFSIIWAEEVSQYLMIWIAFLGAGLALREGRHVALELLHDFLPGTLGRKVRMAIGPSCWFFSAR